MITKGTLINFNYKRDILPISIPFKYIIAIDEGYVTKTFASRYKISESDAMEYLSKFIQYKYYIKDYDWSKYIKNIVSKLEVDSAFWTDQYILDINHILISAFRVYNPRVVRKMITRIILHQSSYQKTYKQRREYLEKTFNIVAAKRHANEFLFEERILRATNIYWIIDSCIQELYQSEIEWYLKYNVFENFPQTKFIWNQKEKNNFENEKINWAIDFISNNYMIPTSELRKENGQIRKNAEIMAISINRSIIHIRNILQGLKVNDILYDLQYAPRDNYINLFKHLIKNEWNQVNKTLFSQP